MPACTAANRVKDFIVMKHKLILGLLAAALLLLAPLGSCNRDQPVLEPIPTGPVNAAINLSLPGYLYLQLPGSWAFLSGGHRGVVLVHDFNGEWYAFERTCAYQPTTACSVIQVDSNLLQLRCGTYQAGRFSPCCSSRYGFNGLPNGGPAPRGLGRYSVQKIGNMLYISN
jgi:hypothetical protein